MTPVKVLRPLCLDCVRRPREPDSVRCYECGPGRLKPNTNPQPKENT